MTEATHRGLSPDGEPTDHHGVRGLCQAPECRTSGAIGLALTIQQPWADAIAQPATPLTMKQLAGIRELIKSALSQAGAFCGACGFQPGDRAKCRDCERCLDDYAKALLPLLDTSAERVPALLAELGAKTIEIERLRIEHDRDLTNVMNERDHCEDWADQLANAVGPIELIGEHSSDNNPWANALELITPHAEVEKLRSENDALTASLAVPGHGDQA